MEQGQRHVPMDYTQAHLQFRHAGLVGEAQQYVSQGLTGQPPMELLCEPKFVLQPVVHSDVHACDGSLPRAFGPRNPGDEQRAAVPVTTAQLRISPSGGIPRTTVAEQPLERCRVSDHVHGCAGDPNDAQQNSALLPFGVDPMVLALVHVGHGCIAPQDMGGIAAQGTIMQPMGILPHGVQDPTLLSPVPSAGADAHANPGWHGQGTQGPSCPGEGAGDQGPSGGGGSVLGTQDVHFRRFAAFVHGRRTAALRRTFELWRVALVLRRADQFLSRRGPG